MNQTEWAKLMATDIAWAERVLITAGSFDPVFVVRTPGDDYLIRTTFTERQEKTEALKAIMVFAIAHQATAVSMIAEASQKTVPARPGGSRFSAGVMREVVIAYCSYYDDDGNRQSGQRIHAIIRGSDGRVTGLGLNEDSGAPLMGDFAAILPPANVPDHIREAAKASLPELMARGACRIQH